MRLRGGRPAGALAAFAVAAALAPAAASAQAPAAAPPQAAAPARPRHARVDAEFMRGMIGHHAQALAMTALVPARTARADLRLLAERIEVAQRDEIALMRGWLADRGEAAPDSAGGAHDAHGGGHAGHAGHAGGPAASGAPAAGPRPGMLTPAELSALAAARGPAFERAFLAAMIRHHEGALAMVARFFAAPGAAQEPDTFGFASDVDADQRAEIARMRALLATLGARPGAAPTPRRPS